MDKQTIAIVIPAYRVKNEILDLLAGIKDDVDLIYVVDDCCPQHSGALVQQRCSDSRVQVLVHPRNTGVGGAVISGMRAALADGADLIVKLDGDGQMDPNLVKDLVAPILEGRADYVKGNRFHGLQGLGEMPPLRLFGNAALSFLTKASTGYWQLFDPTNGFIAIESRIAALLVQERVSQRYFFETDLLARLYLMGAVVEELPHRARYGNESSSLKPLAVLLPFLLRHLRTALRRLFYTYFLRSFYPASLELLLGSFLMVIGLVFASWNWAASIHTGIPRTSGTVVIASTTLIIATQCLLAFLSFDVSNYPRRPLAPRLKKRS